MPLDDRSELEDAELITNYHTMRHIERVRNLLNVFLAEILKRGELHDQSKLELPEVAYYAKVTDALSNVTYNGSEYKGFLTQLEPALKHHYARNRHHPEHFKDGVNEMNLVDLVELFCDWKASSERHHDGNIRTSIRENAKRFKLAPQLVRILENTADLLDK